MMNFGIETSRLEKASDILEVYPFLAEYCYIENNRLYYNATSLSSMLRFITRIDKELSKLCTEDKDTYYKGVLFLEGIKTIEIYDRYRE